MAGDFQIAMDYEGFVGAVRVDTNPTGMKHRIGCRSPLPVLLYLIFKHSRIGGLEIFRYF